MRSIAVLAGDERLRFLERGLREKGHDVRRYPAQGTATLCDTLRDAEVIVAPIPFTKNGTTLFGGGAGDEIQIEELLQCLGAGQILFGGNLPGDVLAFCAQRNVRAVDLMALESVSVKNAVATAEGAIAEAVLHSAVNLHGSACLVLGYGRCGKVLAQKLKALDAAVSVAERKETLRVWAEAYGLKTLTFSELSSAIGRFDFIFNTVPAPVLTRELLAECRRGVTLIDLASVPGGTDFAACERLGVNAQLCLGLPGLYAPATSAGILQQAIEACLALGGTPL